MDGPSRVTDAVVRDAMGRRLLLQFEYEGLPRIVEPHAYGILDGHRQLLAYQVGGACRSGHIPDWRVFDLDKATLVQVMDRAFAGRRPGNATARMTWEQTLALVA